MKITAFTLAGFPVDALDQGTVRFLRKIADKNCWIIEDVMTNAAECYAARRRAEKELETKIIEFPGVIRAHNEPLSVADGQAAKRQPYAMRRPPLKPRTGRGAPQSRA